MPLQYGGVQTPSRERGTDRYALDIAVTLGNRQKLLDQLCPIRPLPLLHLAGEDRFLPERVSLDIPQQPRARSAVHHVRTRLALVLWAFVQNQVPTSLQLFVGRKGPTLVQIGVGAGTRPVLLHRVKKPALQTQLAAHKVK